MDHVKIRAHPVRCAREAFLRKASALARSRVAPDNARHAPHGLGCDMGSCQAPAPGPRKERASSPELRRALGRPRPRHYRSARAVVCPRVQGPQTIEKRAAPNQCRSGKRGHGCAKKHEDANRVEKREMSLLRRARRTGKPPSSRTLAKRGAEVFRTFLTWTDAAKMVVGVDTRGMPVGESNLNGIVAHLRGEFGSRLGLVHGQHGRRGHSRRARLEGL